MKEQTCYYCGALATSREHVPPLAIFPQQKDMEGVDLRSNLITVPSCEIHNQKKSTDDEFLMSCLAGVVGNNYIGYIQTKTKVARAFHRKEKLSQAVIKNAIDFNVKSEDGTLFSMQTGETDNKRLLKCFKQISYGLYFYEFDEVFKGECKVTPGFLNYSDKEIKTLQELLEKKEKTDAVLWPKKGHNPTVFYYQFSPPDEFGLITLILTFYEGAKVYVCFQKESIDLSNNLFHLLRESGIPISFEFPDGSEFKFTNKKQTNI